MIEIIQHQTPEMMYEGYQEQHRLMVRPFFRVFLNFFALLWLIGAIAMVLNNPRSPELGVAMAILFGYLLAEPWIKKWKCHRLFREHPSYLEPVTWTFTPQGYVATGHLGSQTYTWPKISRIVCTPRGLLIYPTPKIHLWFPARLFAKPEDMAQVFGLAKAGGVRKTDKR